MKNNKNEVQIYGVIMDIQPGTFFKDGEKFVRFYIGAKRTSGNVDLLPVAIPETQIGETVGIQAGINDQYANAYNFILEKK